MARFRRDGYLVLPSLFGGDELDVVRRSADRIAALAINSSLALRRHYPRMDAELHDDGRLTLRKIGPIRTYAQDFEARYRAMVGSGDYQDQFIP